MRILHLVAGAKWTGPAAVAIDQVRALRDAGVEAEIGFTAESPLAERFASTGWARPMLSPGAGPAAFLRDVGRISETLDRERFDLVHTHASHDHLVALAAAPRSRFPIVRTLHHVRTIRARWGTGWTLRRCAGYGFANSAIEREFRARYDSAAPGRVLPPVVDRERFHDGEPRASLLESFGVPRGSFVAGTIGKIARGRGQDAALRILARADADDIALLLIGKGEGEAEIRRLEKELGVARRTHWTGYQDESLPDLYRSMHAFLFTASGADQGHRAVLEAIASGVPVVSLEVPGIEDARLVKGAGFVCRTEAEAASALGFLRSHPEQRAAMGRFAREASRRFSEEAFASEAAGFYEEALDFWNNRNRRRVTVPLRAKS